MGVELSVLVRLAELFDDSPVPKPDLDPEVADKPLRKFIPLPVGGTRPVPASGGRPADLGEGKLFRHPQLNLFQCFLWFVSLDLPDRGRRGVYPFAGAETNQDQQQHPYHCNVLVAPFESAWKGTASWRIGPSQGDWTGARPSRWLVYLSGWARRRAES